MRILVADDSKTTLGLITVSLEKLGHTVITANNSQEAIEIYQKDRPDLIILDVMMEGINGFECARQIRAINTDDWIPIIFLSGAVDDENIEKGINAGGDDYLTKPYSEVTLASKIKAMQRIATMRKKLYETTQQLAILSSTDALTGIYNRFQFEKIIKEMVDKTDQHEKSIALLFIDLDNFKNINDNLGHFIGDLLLREVAGRLTTCLRLNDFIARIGGDEFAIILDDISDKEIAGNIAQKIIDALMPSYKLAGKDIHISSSIGIAHYSAYEMSVDTFIQKADIAMYHAKELGRNNYQYFTEELEIQHNQQIYLENAFKFALERHELFLKYQPVFNLKTKEITRIEALVYWEHPEMGMIPDTVFVPLAEKLGLIDTLGRWVLTKVCEQGEQWVESGFKNLKLSVNISIRQLMHESLPETIKNLLTDTDFSSDHLEFELSETSLTYSTITLKIINRIHDLGINIMLDGFGTGSSSLIHLQHLPIKAIKIDKGFVKNILVNENSSIIIKSIIALANNLNMDVIAEGIETEEQLQFLIKNGCVQGQGLLMSKPASAEQMTLILQEQNTVV